MKSFLIASVLAVALMGGLANAQTQYVCYLNGANETPPNASLGWGVGRFILSADQDSLYYSLFWKLPTTYSASHIHFGAAGVAGAVVFNLQSAGATGSHGGWAIDATNLARLNAGTLYVNVHSNVFPNGEIRAQILPGQIQDGRYTSALIGGNEVPPNASTGWGIGTYFLSPDNDSLYYSYFWVLTGSYLGSHIHFATQGIVGAVQHNLQNHNATGAHGAWAIDATNLTRLNSDLLYVNAHTGPTWPNGEIRDQLHYHPPQPELQLSQSELDFSPTYVGMSVQQSFTVTNTGGGTLNVSGIVGKNHVFEASPSTFGLGAGQQQLVTVTFSPTFDHDFKSEFVVQSNDSVANNHLMITGTGCHPVQQPGAPNLHNAGASDALYFSLPWDENYTSTQYAIEVSDDNFAHSWFIDEFGVQSELPEFHTLGIWGSGSAGVILGLEPSTLYSVRLIANDCTGSTLTGGATTRSTGVEVHTVDSTELVITRVDADSIKLSWNPVVTTTEGDTMPTLGFSVFAGNTSGLFDELVGNSTTGEITLQMGSSVTKFFQVSPIIADYESPHPFISWPPDGVTLSGLNSVVILDYLHSEQWDSFEVIVDPAGAATVIGTNWNDPVTERDAATIQYDFDNLVDGPHIVSFRVYDFDGSLILPSADVNIVVEHRPAYVSFAADYNTVSKQFSCDTLNAVGLESGLVDIWWQNTQGQQGYGPSFDFIWDGQDSLNLVKPIPVISPNVLSENSITAYLSPAEHAGVVPRETFTTIDFAFISCCCDNLQLLTGGAAEGEYQGEKNRTLGPRVSCANGEYNVSYAFEVVITYKYFLVESGGVLCEYGQDLKRTDTRTVGECTDATTFTPLVPAVGSTGHKKEGTTQYPFSGSSYGNDHYGSRPGDTGVVETTLGKKSWYDRPESKGKMPRNAAGPLAVKVKREAQFVASAMPQCAPVNVVCCRQWDLSWEIIFCEDCSIRQLTPPTITNEVTPGDCPELAQ
ncbi:MAG: CHRD domain-containing protein [bacterium]|nr:CHRD domain-containing protein [bacterium]